MSVDVKIFTICDHFSGNIQYELHKCPKCLGKGYYYDISFDNSGQAILATGTIKLQQEMLKIINDVKGENKFFPQWGSELHNVIGTKYKKLMNAKVQMMVRLSLEYLRALQLDQNAQYSNFTNDEILQGIESIELSDYIVGIDISVTIMNQSEDLLNQTILF